MAYDFCNTARSVQSFSLNEIDHTALRYQFHDTHMNGEYGVDLLSVQRLVVPKDAFLLPYSYDFQH